MIHFTVKWTEPDKLSDSYTPDIEKSLEREIDNGCLATSDGSKYGLPITLSADGEELDKVLGDLHIDVVARFFNRRIRDGTVVDYQISGIRKEAICRD